MPRPTIEMSVGENHVKWWLHSHFAWSLVLLKNKQSFLFVYLLPTTAGKDEWIVLGAEMGWAEKLNKKEETISFATWMLMLREIHPEVKEREEAWSKGWSEKSVMGKWLKLEAGADACLNRSFTEWRYPLAHPSSWTSLKSAFSSFKNLSLTHKTQWYKLRYRRAGRGQAVSFSSGTSFSHRGNLCCLFLSLWPTFSSAVLPSQ